MLDKSKLVLVGLEALDEQSLQLAQADPENPDYVNKAWFFMYCYKVLVCPKRYSHDWGACPYAHTNESARRRDPQRFNYSSCICPNTGKGECPHGPSCRYAHTLFEYWLHPSRFRTQMCKAGTNCKRALCFFAHSPAELRNPEKTDLLAQSPALQLASAAAAMAAVPAAAGLNTAAGCVTDLVTGAGAAGCALDPSVLCLAASGSNLASANTGMDSSSSNVSCATCQGTSPTALNDYTGEFGGNSRGNLSLVGHLPLAPTPQPTPILSNALLGARYAEAPAGPTVSCGLVTSLPQIQELVHQRQQQQQQQQQLVASMAAMSLVQGPVLLEQLPPGALVSNLAAVSTAMSPATTAAAVAPIYGSIMQGMSACPPGPGYIHLASPGTGLVQQPAMSMVHGSVPMQLYQPGVYPMAGNGLQYTWM